MIKRNKIKVKVWTNKKRKIYSYKNARKYWNYRTSTVQQILISKIKGTMPNKLYSLVV